MSAKDITVVVEDAAWKKSGVTLSRIRVAAGSALMRTRDASFLPRAKRGGGSICVAEMPPPPLRGTSPTLRAGEERKECLTLLLTNDTRLQSLNAQFRGKDVPTNVLSFPTAGDDSYLGDIAIALGLTAREAAAAGISLEAHTLHLAVHGVLHLLGYDHVRSREARIMEQLEISILDELGIANPYAAARR
jgi:probable rRNA maturation factor